MECCGQTPSFWEQDDTRPRVRMERQIQDCHAVVQYIDVFCVCMFLLWTCCWHFLSTTSTCQNLFELCISSMLSELDPASTKIEVFEVWLDFLQCPARSQRPSCRWRFCGRAVEMRRLTLQQNTQIAHGPVQGRCQPLVGLWQRRYLCLAL